MIENHTGEIVERCGYRYKLIGKVIDVIPTDGCIMVVLDNEPYWAQPVEDLDKQWPKRRGKCSP